MGLPQPTEYHEAIQNPRHCFRDPDLRQGQPVLDTLGLPRACCGNFADVYHIQGPGNQAWAVKCFTREVPGLERRYQVISDHLRQGAPPFMVDFRFLEEGIRAGGHWHPVLKMRWVEGLSLNAFVRDNVDKPHLLERLAQLWVKLSQQLRGAGMAHGDLQHDNILLVARDQEAKLALRLIDYDGIFVPALAQSRPGEVGHPNYQHPQRLCEGTYDPTIDRFPHLLIYTALRALAVGGKALWERHDNGENLLFREKDFQAPAGSRLFQELWRLGDPTVHVLVGHLALASQRRLSFVPVLDELAATSESTSLSAQEEGVVAKLLATGSSRVHPVTRLAAASVSAAPTATPTDYHEAVQNPAFCFNDPELRQGQPETNALDLPRARSGNFADVYRVHCPATGNTWAVKCFTRGVPGLQQRYQAVSDHLAQHRLKFMVDFQYLEQGIRVRDRWHPILKMRWVEGLTLNEFVKEQVDNPHVLERLAQLGVKLAHQLRGSGVAHGDLQHGNVMLVAGDQAGKLGLRLIDYDGMFVPALAQSRSGEVGHPNYQHPRRLHEGTYNGEVDRFPYLVIYTALRCLAVAGRSLWDRYDNGENLLFREADFREPGDSALFQELWQQGKPSVRALVGHLLLASQAPLDNAPLLEDLLTTGQILPLTPDQENRVQALLAGSRPWDLAMEPGTSPLSMPGPALKQSAQWYDTAQPALSVPLPGEPAPGANGYPGIGGAKERKPLWAGLTRRHLFALVPLLIVGSLVTIALVVLAGHFLVSEVQEHAVLRETVTEIPALAQPKTSPEPALPESKTSPEPALPESKTSPEPTPPEPKTSPEPTPPEAKKSCEPMPPKPKKARQPTRPQQPLPPQIITLSVKRPVECVAFSPDGKRLASASADKTVKVWDAETGQDILTLKGHTGPVLSVAFSPDGQRLVSGSAYTNKPGGELKVWDATTGQETLTLKGHTDAVTSVAFSPDGKRLVSGSWDRTVKVWDTQTRQEALTLKGHNDWVSSVAFSPDGKRLVSGSWDETVKVWDAQTGQNTLTLKGHLHRVTSVAFSPDGQRLASGSWDKTVKIWDAQTGQESLTLKGHISRVLSVAFSPDGQRLASGSQDEKVKIWDAQTGQNTFTLQGHIREVTSVAFSLDGKRLASGSWDGTVKLWNLAAEPLRKLALVHEIRSFRGHTGWVSTVAFSPDGKQLASGSQDKALMVWDIATGQHTRSFQGHTGWVSSVAFSPDGKRLASSSADHTVKVWDVETGQEGRTLRGHTMEVTSVTFRPDGKRLVSSSWDHSVMVWNVQAGQEILTLKGHTDRVSSATFSPDGKRLASGSWDQTVKLWDATTGQDTLTFKGHTGPVLSVAFRPDGKCLASGSVDHTVKVWNLTTGQDTLTFKGHTGPVLSVAFSHDGKCLASGSWDKTVKLWHVTTGEDPITFKGHTGIVSSVAISPDGKTLASGAQDGTVKLWNLGTD